MNIGELFPFVSKKEKILEIDSLRNEIVNMFYEYDSKTLKLLLKVIKDLKEWPETKD